MKSEERNFQSAHEIGKICNSLLDRKVLCEFFLEISQSFIQSSAGFLYLLGANDQIWLETSIGSSDVKPEEIEKDAQSIVEKGRPVLRDKAILVPLLVRNTPIGAVCFFKGPSGGVFTQQDLDIIFDLASQASSSLKNLFLFEENVRMEKLAAIGETISMVMHEIKNIIQIAKLSDELVRRGLKDRNQRFIDHGLEGMSKAIHQMDGFVWDMLSLTKDYKIEAQKVNIPDLLKELQHDLQAKADQLSVKLDFQAEGITDVFADSRSLYRAFVNLTQNAMEACGKEDSWVRIRVRPQNDEMYVITIEDNGEGMSAEVKARLFQAFFSTKGKKGTGLGLLIASKTFHAHRGSVQVESELGKGTKFIISLALNPSIEASA